jgi:hypothetical protein
MICVGFEGIWFLWVFVLEEFRVGQWFRRLTGEGRDLLKYLCLCFEVV